MVVGSWELRIVVQQESERLCARFFLDQFFIKFKVYLFLVFTIVLVCGGQLLFIEEEILEMVVKRLEVDLNVVLKRKQGVVLSMLIWTVLGF